MGTWTAEDSQVHTENPDYKIQPNMAYVNKRKTSFKHLPNGAEQTEETKN